MTTGSMNSGGPNPDSLRYGRSERRVNSSSPPPPSGLVSGDYAIKPLGGLVTAIGVLVPITAGLGLLFALLNELSLNDARLFLAGRSPKPNS